MVLQTLFPPVACRLSRLGSSSGGAARSEAEEAGGAAPGAGGPQAPPFGGRVRPPPGGTYACVSRLKNAPLDHREGRGSESFEINGLRRYPRKHCFRGCENSFPGFRRKYASSCYICAHKIGTIEQITCAALPHPRTLDALPTHPPAVEPLGFKRNGPVMSMEPPCHQKTRGSCRAAYAGGSNGRSERCCGQSKDACGPHWRDGQNRSQRHTGAGGRKLGAGGAPERPRYRFSLRGQLCCCVGTAPRSAPSGRIHSRCHRRRHRPRGHYAGAPRPAQIPMLYPGERQLPTGAGEIHRASQPSRAWSRIFRAYRPSWRSAASNACWRTDP